MKEKLLYITPRLLSILFTSFLLVIISDGIKRGSWFALFISIIVGCAVIVGIVVGYKKYKNDIVFAFFPLSLWICLVVYGVLIGLFREFHVGDVLIFLVIFFVPIFVTIVAWGRELIGGVLFIFLGMVYSILLLNSPNKNIFAEMIGISMPMFIIGGLYIWYFLLQEIKEK